MAGGKVYGCSIPNGKAFEKELDLFLSMAEGWGDLEVSRNPQVDYQKVIIDVWTCVAVRTRQLAA